MARFALAAALSALALVVVPAASATSSATPSAFPATIIVFNGMVTVAKRPARIV
jgi:hypothetical protein